MTTKLLAGPILRRTTINRVCVWLATSQPVPLRLVITDLRGNPLGQSILDDVNKQRVQLGKNLIVYLLQARPDNNAEFPRNALLYYRLEEIDADNQAHILNLADLTYGSFLYPTFFIPTRIKQLLHGSCRKPHGGMSDGKQGTTSDALSYGDDLLERTHYSLKQRPSLLLLTGDQIYADDVAISLFAMLRQQALTLTGKQETLPLSDDPLLPRLDPSSILLHGRKRVLKEKYAISSFNTMDKKASGFSSNESENHLLTFGEFAAMYLYALGNHSAWEPVWDWNQLKNSGIANPMAAEEAWRKQKDSLASYHKTLCKVRRLLANIPTYMIFDDHDVTDDWNITGNWCDDVRQSPLGRRIVANALAAYWAFQAWGNDPDNFDKDLILSITQQLNDHSDNHDISERYDLHIWKNRGWGFSIPTDPPIIAMDSRTQRQYANPYYPAMLVDRYALDWLQVEWAKLKTEQNINSDTCPIVIAATPVTGPPIIQFAWQLLLWLAKLTDSWKPIRLAEELLNKKSFISRWEINQLDMESWGSNKEGLLSLMDTLCQRMNIEQCLFLSGDVHYSFTAKSNFRHQGHTLQCYQLTSSALSNYPDSKQSQLLENATKQDANTKMHHNWTVFPSQYWSIEVELLKAQRSGSRITTQCNLGLVEFANGLPINHTLLIGKDDQLVFRLNA